MKTHCSILAQPARPGRLQPSDPPPRPPTPGRFALATRIRVAALVLLSAAGLPGLLAANLLTNPGFEEGQNGWGNPNAIRGGASIVITDPTLARTGNNVISNYNESGWSSAYQGDAAGQWSTGVSLPVADSRFYRLSAWVKVPGAAVTPQAITLRYRFEPTGNRIDVGQKTISTDQWTFLDSGWIQPPPGDYFMSYWEVHSLANGVVFYADDCGLEESEAFAVQGQVVDGQGNGVDATVVASSPEYTSPPTTAFGGQYFLSLPAGTYTIAASSPGLKGSRTQVVTGATTVPNIVLATDPDYDPELIFNALTTAIVPGLPWPTVNPAGAALTPIAGPEVQSFGGVPWSKHAADGPGYRFATYTEPLAIQGASIVVVAKPKRMPSDNWDSIVDVFYSELMLGIRNDSGVVNVFRKGFPVLYSTAVIPEDQTTVLSLVVQPTGEFKVWANGTEIMNDTSTADMTSLAPINLAYGNKINVGRNDPDAWTTFNGYIGDVYLYNVAISDQKRTALEQSLMAKFITNATLSYTITATAGPNGSISPAGPITVVQGHNQTFTLTAASGYVVSDLLVDGVSVGPRTSYTFTGVGADHSIAATFVSMPAQTITASAAANGSISPSGAVTVPAGADQTFHMLPQSGYAVQDVVVDGVSQGEIYSYTFPFVVAPHTVSVTFRALSMNIPKADQLIFSVVADALPANGPTGPWPTYVPAGRTLTVLGGGAPEVEILDGVKWERNVLSQWDRVDGFRFGTTHTAPIPCSGASIVTVAKPTRDPTGTWSGLHWSPIVDVFYNRLSLGIRSDTGDLSVWVNGALVNTGVNIPDGQTTVLSLVVEPSGEWKVWANLLEVLSGSSAPMTALTPGAAGHEKYINVGRNDPDGWTTFNGHIGDAFLYKTALTASERQQIEHILAAKYGAPLPLTLPVSGVVVSGGVPALTFPTVAGYKYRLLYVDDLASATWLPVISPPNNPEPDGWSAVSTGAPITITDPSASGRSERFYRLEQAEP